MVEWGWGSLESLEKLHVESAAPAGPLLCSALAGLQSLLDSRHGCLLTLSRWGRHSALPASAVSMSTAPPLGSRNGLTRSNQLRGKPLSSGDPDLTPFAKVLRKARGKGRPKDRRQPPRQKQTAQGRLRR